MPVYNTFNFSKLVVRTTHATPSTVVLRPAPSIHHSHQRFPDADQVQSGAVFGPGQLEQQEYLTGTYTGSGGSGNTYSRGRVVNA